MGKGDVYGVLLSKLKQVTQQYDLIKTVCVCVCVYPHIYIHIHVQKILHMCIYIYTRMQKFYI